MDAVWHNVVIVGGHGKVAQLLTKDLVARGDQVTSLIRNQTQVDSVAALGATPLVFDIETMDARDLAPFFKGADTVVFAAGAGYGSGALRKRTVDYGGSVLSQRAALDAGVPRFIQISTLNAEHPIDPESDHVWKEYVRAKRDADRALRETALDWVIARPGILTDDPGTGSIRAARRLPELAVDSLSIPRADVAAILAYCVHNSHLSRLTFDAVTGSTPIEEALANL
ncbi:NAD(P)H-binding protein [Actinomycetaceae bacterium WB03_NA08]|uniref:NAD(P)H-binding protein n=1 Tax=Scrofimicrobium canadense TaxID=2652290 RepID=A0A6N7VNG4_9ACTO|nr:NAD(P)H-binding protein [Scrofimicrobium canadense]MSS83217.1 NAD(P)H-binding protein [Scrofimicrobium canadense]